MGEVMCVFWRELYRASLHLHFVQVINHNYSRIARVSISQSINSTSAATVAAAEAIFDHRGLLQRVLRPAHPDACGPAHTQVRTS